ncbi:ATP-binding protein [Coprococcus comes]|uniref:ATP-binding protein n=1 Tax=Coprococcus comes TaxID=410072 RepID=UPI003219FAF1
MTDNFKEIGSLFGREGAGAGFAKQTDKESFTYAFAWPEGDTWATLTGYLNLDEQPEEYVRRVLQDGGFRSDWGKRSGNLERILAPDLLILEDLGAQRSTEYVMEHVYDVIDGRYKAGKPMVITTNFDFRERILNATADDPWGRVFDRIVEVGFPVKYDGNSRRREIGMKNRKDFKRKLGIEGIES